jgi:hypothetical protein
VIAKFAKGRVMWFLAWRASLIEEWSRIAGILMKLVRMQLMKKMRIRVILMIGEKPKKGEWREKKHKAQ